MGLANRIMARALGEETAASGRIVDLEVDTLLTHDPYLPLIKKALADVGIGKVRYQEKAVIAFDHIVPPDTVDQADAMNMGLAFVEDQGFTNVFRYEGVCHQILPEKGFARPGRVVVGTDSHTVTAGAFGSFATGIGAIEAVEVLLRGKCWFKVPGTIRVMINGELGSMVSGKDVALKVIAILGTDGALYKAVEFAGPVVDGMSIDSRMVLSNMSVEMGAKVGLISPDIKTWDYLAGRVDDLAALKRWWLEIEAMPDPDGAEKTVEIVLTGVGPQVAVPYSPGNGQPVEGCAGERISQAFIGSCTGGRMEDMRQAAGILKGKKMAGGVRLIIIPASREIYGACIREGLMEVFNDCGAMILNPGCGLCGGFHQGLIGKGDVMISTQNRNFLGRSGSPQARIYLASAATVAASAVAGRITDPRII